MKPRESRSKEQDEMSAMWEEQTAKEYHNITTPAQRVHRMKDRRKLYLQHALTGCLAL